MQSRFPPGAFARQDETPDALFYREARLVTHIDDYAIAAVGEAYRQILTPVGEFLDLMSSWVSHFPADYEVGRLVGLGMNEEELRANPRLDEYVVRDLNAEPSLPYDDGCFDGVVICVSVQYLTQPVAVFKEVGRVLKPGAPLIVTYSNRCFPTKAVAVWRMFADDEEHGQLVATYAQDAGCFAEIDIYDFSPASTFTGVPEKEDLRRRIASGQEYTDPLYAVVARAKSEA